MIKVNEGYRNQCKKPIRESYYIVKYGLFDKQAKYKISSCDGSHQSFSSLSKTYDEIKNSVINYISCEPNRVKLNNSFAFVRNKNKSYLNENIPYWSLKMSNENCLFDNNPTITYIFNSTINFTDLTLYFKELIIDLNIVYYLNNEINYTNKIRNNTKLEFQTVNENDTNKPKYFDKIVIEFIKTGSPYRYVKFEEIDFGVYHTFNYDEIEDISIIDEIDIKSSQLSSNSLDLTIKDYNNNYDILNPYNKLSMLQERQEMTLYYYLKVGAIYKELPIGTYLLKSINFNNNKLKIESYDSIYFLNKMYYGSKFYNNENAVNVIEDLFNYYNIDSSKYEIDSKISNDYVTGYIGQVEGREALRKIAESLMCIVSKNRYGITKIFKEDRNGDTVSAISINEQRNLIPNKNLYNNVIDINSYTYTSISDKTILYKSTLNKGTYTIDLTKFPLYTSKYEDDPNSLKNNDGDYNVLEVYATNCLIEVNSDNQDVELSGIYLESSSTIHRVKKNDNLIVDDYAIDKVDNTLINNNNYYLVAIWKLDRSEISYEYSTNITPYLECGDICNLQTKYSDLNGKSIYNKFTITHIEFTNNMNQETSGE